MADDLPPDDGDLPDGPDPFQGRPPRWDDDDPRRQLDSMAPPTDPCECHCIECGRRFPSGAMWLQRVVNAPPGREDGFWMCPTPNCGGAGFTFDVFPVDPDHPANAGWVHDEPEEGIEWEEADGSEDEEDEEDGEYDPSEPFYAALDAEATDEGDVEGEEWKHGQSPDDWLAAGASADADGSGGLAWADDISGENDKDDEDEDDGYDALPWSDADGDDGSDESYREAQERRYDEPDARPRVVEWSDLHPHPSDPTGPRRDGAGDDLDDDLPF